MPARRRRPSLDELGKRVAPLLDQDWMRQRSVAVLGVGSGGSLVAWWLAASGVGRLLLVDPDRLEPHNVWRHLCGVDDLGRRKVEAVAERLAQVNPHGRYTPLALDAVAEEGRFLAALRRRKVELLVVATDTTSSRRAANRAALELRIPAVYGGCFDGGTAGEVAVARPGGACWGCIGGAVGGIGEGEEEQREDVRPHMAGYGSQAGVRGLGLGMSVALVASLQAHVALWVLREGAGERFPLGGNYFLIGSKARPPLLTAPFALRTVAIARRKDCLACNSPSQPGLAGKAREILARARARCESAIVGE